MYKAIIQQNDISRAAYKDGIDAYIKRLASESYAIRDTFMPTENFLENIEKHRTEYV